MGFIGSEVAASLRQMGLDVTVVLRGTTPLSGVLGDEAAQVLAIIHREHGVHLVPGDQVIGLEGNHRVERAITANGKRLDCDLVIAAVGIELGLEPLSGSGIAIDNGILVDQYCRTNVPDVVAAGDAANVQHPVFGRVRVEHFNNAEKQGRAAARALLGSRQPFDYIYSFWSDQYEHSLEYVGFARHWDRTILRGSYETKKFLLFYLAEDRVQAVLGLNRGGDPELQADSELRACQDLIHAHGKVSASALADERVDLRSLLPQ
jgi:3-phenylpropionate/trans-cinnamate dioxygenase ferredoxin reductase subunit